MAEDIGRAEVRVVSVEVHQLDCRPAADAWCALCALPSLVEVDWAYVDTDTLRMIGRSSTRWCQECGRSEAVRITG